MSVSDGVIRLWCKFHNQPQRACAHAAEQGHDLSLHDCVCVEAVVHTVHPSAVRTRGENWDCDHSVYRDVATWEIPEP